MRLSGWKFWRIMATAYISAATVFADIRKKLPKNDNNMVKYGLKTPDPHVVYWVINLKY